MRSTISLIGLSLAVGLSLASLKAQEGLDIEQKILLAEEALEENNYVKTYTLTRPLLENSSKKISTELLRRASVLAAVSEIRVYPEDSVDLSRINYRSFIERLGLSPAMESLNAAGDFFYKEQEYNTALTFYLRVDSLFKKHPAYNTHILKALLRRSEISKLTFTYESVEDAYNLLKEALELAQTNADTAGVFRTYIQLSDVSGLVGEIDQSKFYLDEAFPYFMEKDDVEMVSRLYLLKYGYYSRTKAYDQIVPVFEELLTYLNEKENPKELGKSLYYFGHFLGYYQKDYKSALPILKRAKQRLDEVDDTKTEIYHRLLRDLGIASRELGNIKDAATYFDLAYHLKIDLVKMANRRRSREMEAQYRNLEKQQEIALLNSQNELISQQKANQRNLFIAGFALLGILSLGLFFLYRNRRRTNEKLLELDALKSNFFTNISHEIRTPLTLINIPLQQRLASAEITSRDREEFEMMERNTNRLLHLVDQLLDLSKLEVGKYQLKLKEGDLGSLIHSMASSFKLAAEQKDIEFKADVDTFPRVRFDADIVEKIITNLLSNAIKYTPQAGYIRLGVTKDTDHFEIILENSTDALDALDIEKLFDRFYQADKLATGVGVGLSLVKELIDLYKGTIKVSREKGYQLRFTVKLPVWEAILDDTNMGEDQREVHDIDVNSSMSAGHSGIWQPHMTEEDLPILLVVEDHPEVQKLISQIFASNYRIILANNGEEGVNKAFEYIPDLVISDIMMPGTDGYNLCAKLKEDERTSHIPIILLTAKAGDEDKHKGLLTGADAYVTKPFSVKLLETRVKNLIHTRDTLRTRYSQEVILKPKDIAITDLDELFLSRVQSVMDDKLIESTFSVQEFSEAVGLSRMQLHRKLKALTGLSASEFIRSQRLKLAASLLEKSNANVSQIGYQVGFNDPSYFSKCFKEAYGQTPTQYSHTKAS